MVRTLGQNYLRLVHGFSCGILPAATSVRHGSKPPEGFRVRVGTGTE